MDFEYVKAEWADELKKPRDGDVGYDLTIYKLVKITETGVRLYDTGIRVKPPKGYYVDLVVRSSFPIKTGFMPANGFGVIDPSYRNNILLAVVPVLNLSTAPALQNNGKLKISGIMEGMNSTIKIDNNAFNVSNVKIEFTGEGRSLVKPDSYNKNGEFDIQGKFHVKIKFKHNGVEIFNGKNVDMRLNRLKFVDNQLVANPDIYINSQFISEDLAYKLEYKSKVVGEFKCDVSHLQNMMKISPPTPIKLPMRAAQLVFRKVNKFEPKITKSLEDTDRKGGFGSTD